MNFGHNLIRNAIGIPVGIFRDVYCRNPTFVMEVKKTISWTSTQHATNICYKTHLDRMM